MNKPILCLDFDGVIHSYVSGWRGADIIPDPPVEGALEAILLYQEHFTVAILSSRSHQPGGLEAMRMWLRNHLTGHLGSFMRAEYFVNHIEWPTSKPPAMVTLDDRALTFEGGWPSIEELLSFKPWYKRETLSPEQRNDALEDSAAAGRFCCAMRAKLAKDRDKGRAGWQEMQEDELWGMLIEHAARMQPIDVANFCMMIYENRIRARAQQYLERWEKA